MTANSAFTPVPPRRSALRDYSFGWVLLTLFVASIVGQYFTQLAEFRNEARALGETFVWNEFWPAFGRSVFENWQSEWAQLLVQVAGLKWLLFRGSAQSKEANEEATESHRRLRELVSDLDVKLNAVLEALAPPPSGPGISTPIIHPPSPRQPRPPRPPLT